MPKARLVILTPLAYQHQDGDFLFTHAHGISPWCKSLVEEAKGRGAGRILKVLEEDPCNCWLFLCFIFSFFFFLSPPWALEDRPSPAVLGQPRHAWPAAMLLLLPSTTVPWGKKKKNLTGHAHNREEVPVPLYLSMNGLCRGKGQDPVLANTVPAMPYLSLLTQNIAANSRSLVGRKGPGAASRHCVITVHVSLPSSMSTWRRCAFGSAHVLSQYAMRCMALILGSYTPAAG
ncbi:hypothetical protein GGI35DRAFT_266819 [Trichoderma velutinum]